MIFFLFYLSGFSALVYEIIWSRILSLIFGASVYGQSIVLSLFMGGLAYGAKYFGKKLKHIENPLAFYGILEGSIAFFGLGTLFLTKTSLFLEFQNFHVDLLFKVIISSIYILPTTILMGGTFPTLFKVLKKIDNSSSLKKISSLYTINTLGALTGIFACNYFFIVNIGMKLSIVTASLTNIFIFILLKTFYKIKFFSFINLFKNLFKNDSCDESKKVNYNKSIMFALMISGFATMVYEISWSRALNFSFGSSTFTFSLIVFSYIAGLSLGSFWMKTKKDMNEKKKRVLLCDLQIMAIVSASVFSFFILRIPLVIDNVFKICSGVFWKVHLLEISILFVFITPTAFFIGSSFPLMCTLTSNDSNPSEEVLGISYSFNTFGSILGAIFTGFILISLIGPFNVIYISILLHLVIIFFITGVPFKINIKNHIVVIVLALLFVYFHLSFFENRDILQGHYANIYSSNKKYIPKYLSNNEKYWNNRYKKLKIKTNTEDKILFFKHGLLSSIAVMKRNNLRLVIDGKTDASVGVFYNSDMPTQSLLAFLPLVTYEHNQNKSHGLVVGYGSGVTAGIISKYTYKLDCLEIEKEVLEASHYFKEYNLNASESKNINIILGDARKYIRQTKFKYDFISAEPSNIWVSGVAHLFTKEYFEDCKELLKPSGVMVQWLHVYKLSFEDFKVALNTFINVFNNFEIWGSFNYGDIFIIGWKDKKPLNFDKYYNNIIKKYYYKKEMEDMGAYPYNNFLQFRLISSNNNFISKLKDDKIHTDDKPVLEYSAAKNMFIIDTEKIYKFLEEN